jgi:hypothetical protein
MEELETWFLYNNLVINTEKTQVMLFKGKCPSSIIQPNLAFNKKEITYTSNLKFLGIHIPENLTWSTHIPYLCNSQSKAVYLVKALRNIVSQPVMRNIYFAKFQSKLRYGIILWGAENSSKKVFIMQKKMLQTIKRVNNWVSCR